MKQLNTITCILAALCLSVSALAQDRAVNGRVLDKETGEAVIGAYVINAATRDGVPTDSDGAFTIKAAVGQTLNVSSIGYAEVSVKVPASGDIVVRLSAEAEFLDDAVVVGYSSQKRVNITGAVSTISSAELENRPAISAIHMLQGVDPSLNISVGSGNPVGGVDLDIRGVTSINGGSPLVLVDGVPGMNLKYINADDIESISVLKDASASAIYGAKASAGVVLVTTKSGKAGNARVTYTNNFSWTQPTTPHEFMTNGYEYAKLVGDLYYSRYNYYPFNDYTNYMAALEERRYDKTENPARPWVDVGDDGKYHYYGNFDWYNNIYNTNRFGQRHDLSVSGGSGAMNYYVSGSIYSQEGVLGGPLVVNPEQYSSNNFRAKFDVRLFKWAKWATNVAYNGIEQNYPGMLNEAQTIAALEENVVPMFVPVNPDGSIVMYPADLRNIAMGKGRTAQLSNPNDNHIIQARTLTMSNSLDLDITSDLRASFAYNVNNFQRLYKDRTTADTYSDAIGVYKTTEHYTKDYYRERPYEYLTQSIDIYATYIHSWDDAHNFKAVAGSNYEWYDSRDNTVWQYGVGSENMATFNSKLDDSRYQVEQSLSQYKTLGFFGRLNYDYKGRYLLELSGRYDGTSRFARDQRWGIFPSASAGWRFTEESFLQGIKGVINYGKLRLSYGALGNQQVSNYLYIDRITSGTSSYLLGTGDKINYSGITNPLASDLSWETVYTYNVGLDMNFLDSRLSFTGDAYIRDTKGMLTETLTLPSVYGADTPRGNCADMRTTGWEIEFTWRDKADVLGSPLSYTIHGSLGDYKRVITKFNNPTKIYSDYYEGKVLGEIWGYHVPRLFESDAEAQAYQMAVNNSSNVYQRVYNMQNSGYLRAGDVMFEDRDGSGSIGNGAGTVDDPGDMMIIGNSSPRYGYSFRFDLAWKGFDLSAFFQGIGKRDWYPTANQDDIYGANQFWQLFGYTIPSFITEDFLDDVWTEEHPDRYFPRLRPIQSYNGGPLGQNNDRYMQSVAYLRFKNLTVGYTVPAKIRYVNRIRLYASAENLYYWSPLKKHCRLIDPELAISSGIYKSGTGTGYTMPKTFSCGVNVTF